MVTKKGLVKKTPLTAYSKPRSTGIQAITLEQGDELIDVLVTSGTDNVLLATHNGLAIRFQKRMFVLWEERLRVLWVFV